MPLFTEQNGRVVARSWPPSAKRGFTELTKPVIGHTADVHARHSACPLSGVKRSSLARALVTANDPKGT
jgi:hypothetical protein